MKLNRNLLGSFIREMRGYEIPHYFLTGVQQVNHWCTLTTLNIFLCSLFCGGGNKAGAGNGVGKRKVEGRIALQPLRISIYSQLMLYHQWLARSIAEILGTQNKILSSTGRVFVHEWAHFRWGVFDEYNNEKPFYINGQSQIEVTRLVVFHMFKISCLFFYSKIVYIGS